MTKHVHAELMMQYAQDATETDKPWERWQLFLDSGWHKLPTNPSWDSTSQYRRKPKVILINGIEVPEPMQEKPKNGTTYFVPNLDGESLEAEVIWCGDFSDICWWHRGLCHYTKEAAELHAKALLSFTAK